MNDKSVALFDMDGTLTPVRKKMRSEMVTAINELSRHCKIGIITGSKYAYVTEQIPQLFNSEIVSKHMIDIMPCNGTKLYKYNGDQYEKISEVNMIEKIGQESYNNLVKECNSRQSEILNEFCLPFTGTFIQYRGSLLNWCPIGRDAGDREREAFVKIDEAQGVRMKYKNWVQTGAAIKGIDIRVALGGSTSLDIYPTGWDKTYGLQHYVDHEFCYFVGDKCRPGGNDWHIYERLKKEGRSYETDGTPKTIEIIKDIISRVSKS